MRLVFKVPSGLTKRRAFISAQKLYKNLLVTGNKTKKKVNKNYPPTFSPRRPLEPLLIILFRTDLFSFKILIFQQTRQEKFGIGGSLLMS